MGTQQQHRTSLQKKVILQELCKIDTHPTANEVYDIVRRIIPRISLGTVYRNLELLCSQGLAQKVGQAGGQKRFDGVPQPHAHLRCSLCSRVLDVDYPECLPILPAALAKGFEVSACSLEFVGICQRCKAQMS